VYNFIKLPYSALLFSSILVSLLPITLVVQVEQSETEFIVYRTLYAIAMGQIKCSSNISQTLQDSNVVTTEH